MTIDQVRAAYDEDERRQPFEPTARWITAGGYAAFWSPVYRSGWSLQAPPNDTATVAALRDAVKHAVLNGARTERADGGPASTDDPSEFEWKCFSWDGPGAWYADAVLQTAGFLPRDEEAVVYADVAAIARGTFAVSDEAATVVASDTPREGITVRVATEDNPDATAILADADAVNSAAWDDSTRPSMVADGYWSQTGASNGDSSGGSPPTDPLSAAARPHLSIHVAYFDGRPVSYGRFQVTPGSRFGGLWGGATVADARGRGCYRALVGSRAAEARARGLTWLMVDANPETSYPILRRLGFDLLGYTRPYVLPFGPA
jgi:hypothetical protein